VDRYRRYQLHAVLLRTRYLPYNYTVAVLDPVSGEWIHYDRMRIDMAQGKLERHICKADTFPVLFIYCERRGFVLNEPSNDWRKPDVVAVDVPPKTVEKAPEIDRSKPRPCRLPIRSRPATKSQPEYVQSSPVQARPIGTLLKPRAAAHSSTSCRQVSDELRKLSAQLQREKIQTQVLRAQLDAKEASFHEVAMELEVATAL
jgi:hypothetical protein